MTDESLTTSDGAEFALASEQVRGEPRFYWVTRRLPGEHAYQTSWRGAPDGAYDRRTAMRRLRRAALSHEARLPSGGAANVRGPDSEERR